MTIRRIVTDIATTEVKELAAFYVALFDLDVVMDQEWIITLSTGQEGPVQLSIASEGGGGAPVPDMSIEVDNVDAVHAKAKELGAQVTYALRDEPWGVRRFFVKDPAGKVLNVLSHLTVP
ncbi:MAG: VOC family protein [Pseudomonadota bacterium]